MGNLNAGSINWGFNVDTSGLMRDVGQIVKELGSLKTEFANVAKAADSGFGAVVAELKEMGTAFATVKSQTSGVGREINSMLKGVEKQVENVDKAIRQMDMSKWEKSADNYATNIKKAAAQVELLKDKLNAANVSEKERMELLGKIASGEANIGKLQEQSLVHVQQLKSAEEARLASIKSSSAALGSALRDISLGAGLIGTALTIGLGDAEKKFMELSDTLASFRAVANATDADVSRLVSTAKGLEGIPTTQATAAAVALGRAGLSAKDATDSLGLFSKASISTGESMETVSKIILSTNRAFGRSNSELGDTADILNQVANATDTSVAGIGAGMQRLAGLAHNTNQSLLDTATAMGMLKDAGLSEEVASTALEQALIHLAAPTREAKKAIKELHLEVDNGQGKLKPFAQLMIELREKMQGLSDLEKTDILSKMFDVRGANAVMTWLGQTDEKISETQKAIADYQGSIERTSSIMKDSFGFQVRAMTKDFDDLKMEIAEDLLPVMQNLVGAIRNTVKATQELPEPLKETAVQGGFAFLALSTLLGLLGGGSWAVMSMVKAFSTLQLEMAAAGVEANALKVSMSGLLGATGVGFVVGSGIALGMNVIADRLNKRSDEIDAGIADDQKTKGGLSNALRTGDKKVDVEGARKAAYEAVVNIQRLKTELTGVDDKLAEHLKKYPELGKVYGKTNDAIYEGWKQQKASLTAEITQQEQLKTKYQDLLQVKQKDVAVDQGKAKTNLANAEAAHKSQKAQEEADAARREADKEQVKANADKFKQWDEGDAAFEASLKSRVGAQKEAAAGAAQADSDMAVKLVKSADHVANHVMNSYKWCYKGVHRAFMEAFGSSPFEGDRAYMGADWLAKDNRFMEIQIKKREDLLKLAAGSVVVWGKGTSKSGHISIASGHGTEYSDHEDPQMLSHYGGAAPRVFVPKDQMGKTGAGNAVEQAKINEQITHYNQKLKEAIAYRAELEGKGLKDTESWNQVNSKVAEYKNKLETLSGAASDAIRKNAEDLHQLQEKNLKDLMSQVDSISKSISSQASGLLKDLHQQGMTAYEKSADNFSESISDAQGQVLGLQLKLGQVNLTEKQRKDVTQEIKGLNEDIKMLLDAQRDTLAQMSIDSMLESVKAETDYVNSLRGSESAMKDFLVEAMKYGDVTDSNITKAAIWADANQLSSAATLDLIDAVDTYNKSLSQAALAADAVEAANQGMAISDKQLADDKEAAAKKIADAATLATQAAADLKESIQVAFEAAGSIISTFSTQLKDMGGEAGAVAASVVDVFGNMATGLGRILAGDVLGGALQMFGSLFAGIANMIKGSNAQFKEFLDQTERMKGLLQDNEESALDREVKSLKSAGLPTKDKEQELFVYRRNRQRDSAIKDISANGGLPYARMGINGRLDIDATEEATDQAYLANKGSAQVDALHAKAKTNIQAIRNEMANAQQDIDDNLLSLQEAASQSYMAAQEKSMTEWDAQAKAEIEKVNNLYDYLGKRSNEKSKKAAVEGLLDSVAGSNEELRDSLRSTATDIVSQQDAIIAEVLKAYGTNTEAAQKELNDRLGALAVDSRKKFGDAILANQQKADADAKKAADDAAAQAESDLKKRADSIKKVRTDLYNQKADAVTQLIKGEQRQLDVIDKQTKAYQDQIKLKEALHKSDLKAFDAQDKGMFSTLIGQQDIQGEVRAGLGDIANPEGTPTGTFSAASIQEAMKARVELMTLSNENQLKEEEITKDAYLAQKEKIAAIQAGFANEALKAEGLTNRQRLELEQSRADAYVQFQDAYRESLQTRFDAEIEGINTSIEANNKQAEVYKTNIDGYQTQMGDLKIALDSDLSAIDTRITDLLAAHDEWAAKPSEVLAGIKGPLEEIIGLYGKAKAAIGGITGSASSSPTATTAAASNKYYANISQRDSTRGFDYRGVDGQWYNSTEGASQATAKMATGGVVPFGSNSGGSLAILHPGEPVFPAWFGSLLEGAYRMQGNVNNNQRTAHVNVIFQGPVSDPSMIETAITNALKKADYSAASTNGAYYSNLN